MDARHEAAEGRLGVALEMYDRAIREADEAGEAADPLLHVRVADLHHRLGHERSALASYRLAADRYREEGLILNAVAVWKRVARGYPSHIEAHRALAELHLDQRLVAEARLHLLHFVEAADRNGRSEEAIDALVEFLSLTYDGEVARVLRAYQALLRRRGETDVQAAGVGLADVELAGTPSGPTTGPGGRGPARGRRGVRRLLPVLPSVAPVTG
jgi:tetratricopeptide (TPR) repeat protein